MAYKVNTLELNFEQVAKSKTCLLTAVVPNYAYEDGRRGAQAGFAYDVALPKAAFSTIRIKVENEVNPSITNEIIEAAGGAVDCTVDGFVGKIYVSNGRAELSCRASAVTPIKKPVQAGQAAQ